MRRRIFRAFFPRFDLKAMTTEALLKTSVYGIIYLNSGLFLIGFFFFSHPFGYGVLAGTAAALMKVWVYAEQTRRMEKKTQYVSASAFFLRYSIDALAMGISAFFSIQTLLGCFFGTISLKWIMAVSYTHLRAHETVLDLVCRLLLEKKKTSE